ncbi:ribonuclease domain-containing protein [Arthrobacter sp. 1P04PC]|uniref:ribonuclease domain-containing protein n=1 Tax=unclassified Arthrobacter TaxID=235627 RepID=UPI0039A1AC0A
MTTKRLSTLIGALLTLAVLVLVVAGIPRTGDSPSTATSPAHTSAAASAKPSASAGVSASAKPSASAGVSASAKPSGSPAAARPTGTSVANPSRLPEVRASELPAEARQVLVLIARGGPYPYSRDNITFGNFKRVLPQKPSGYYREFTVPTPGESDRGARRIIAGDAGEKYYTADHYSSFSFIAEGK